MFLREYNKCCGCCRKKDNRFYFRNQYKLYFSGADNPYNIKWENLDQGKTKFCFKLIYVSIVYLIMAVTFFAFILCLSQVSADTEVIDCPTTTIEIASLSGSSISGMTSAQIESLTNCFCKQYGYQTLATEYKKKTEIGQACENYLKNILIKYGLSILIAFCISSINKIQSITLKKLSVFLRYTSESKEVLSIAQKLFIAIFINSSVVTLLTRASIFGFQPGVFPYEITSLKYLKQDDNSVYDNMHRDWYSSIGIKIIWIGLLNIFSPNVWAFLFIDPLLKCVRYCKKSGVVLMKDMVKLKTPPQFDIGTYTAYMLSSLFIVMTFCSGIPILIVFGFLTMFFSYWCIKYKFLRWASRPPTWDQSINDWINKILPFALVLHLGFALWFYTADDIFYPKHNSNWIFQESLFAVTVHEGTLDSINEKAQKHIFITL